MKVFKEISAYKKWSLKLKKGTVGFVPTMGNLHEGHLSLIRASQKENAFTVCSIYVNPSQFDKESDYVNYPRTLSKDLKVLDDNGCDGVFIPNDREMYLKEESIIRFNFGYLEKIMEGLHRDGHFNGVAHIISKFFHIVQPERAYFGLKDLQQCRIIQILVEELAFPVQVRVILIERDQTGVAFSSRNSLMIGEEKNLATHIYKSLQKGRNQILCGVSPSDVQKEAIYYLEKLGIRIEYFEIVNFESLKTLKSEDINIAICVAAYIGSARLIDNIILSIKE